MSGFEPPPGGSVGDDFVANLQMMTGPMAGPPAGAAAPQVSDDPLMAPVFLGTHLTPAGTEPDTPRGYGETTGPTRASKERTIDQLLTEFERMERAEQRRLALLLAIGGYTNAVQLDDAAAYAKDMTLSETLMAYNELLMDAAGRYARGQRVTPEQLLQQAVDYRLPKGANWDGSFGGLTDVLIEGGVISPEEADEITSGEDKPKDLSGTFSTTSSSTNTNTSVSRDIMDPNDAMALTRAMLQRELGRDPTKAEFEDFIGAVQAAQRTSPTRTTSTSTTDTTNTVTRNKRGRVVDSDTDTDTSSSSFTRSGITQAGIEDILLRRARANPDWAEWQAVGTYAPALFQALGATVPGV